MTRKGNETYATGRGDSSALSLSGVQMDDVTLDVTELPKQMWTQDYKQVMKGLVRHPKKKWIFCKFS